MRKQKRIFVMAALLFSFLCFPAGKMLAASNATEVLLSVEQSFEQKSFEKEADLIGNYELRALDAGFPMPEDSQNGIYSFSLKGAQANKIISLQFDRDGVYRYQLTQTTKEKENYLYDRSSYMISAYIKNSEAGEMSAQVIVEKNDGKKYGELKFYNSYNEKIPNSSKSSKPTDLTDKIQTGDSADIIMYAVIAAVGLMLIVVIGYFKRNSRKE